MKRAALVICLAFSIASVASAADVINGCYQKENGQFRVLIAKDACRPSEVLVSLRSATDAAGLNPEMYDANGQFLGVGQAGELYIPALRKWAVINLVDADVFGRIWGGQLYYRSGDCAGEAYSDYEYLHRVFSNGQPAEQRHYTAAPELEPGVVVHGLRDSAGNCETLDFDYAPTLSKAVEVTLPFTTPIALPTTLVSPKTGLAGRPRR